MNARRDSSNEPKRGSFGGRLLLTAAVLFALAATGALVLTDEQRWLRLGIVAALWAALAGAFLAARYRRQIADQEDVLAERQERYELELEREIAARREYELEVVAEARREADEAARDDIAALRQEMTGLRQTLESLLGGEFLVERYALRAESTRMRSLPDDRRLKGLPAAMSKEDNVIPSVVQDAQTDLIERVRESGQQHKRKVEPLPRRAERPGGRTEFPAPERTPHPAEVSDRWFVPDGLGTDQPPPAREDPQQTQYLAGRSGSEGGRKNKKAGKDRRGRSEPVAHAEPGGGLHRSVASGYVEPVSRPRADANGFGPGTSGYMPPVGPAGYRVSAESSGYVPPVGRGESPAYGSSGYGQPAARAESSGYGQPAGRAGSSGYVPPVNRADTSGHGQPAGRAETSGYGRAESSGYGQPAGRAESSGYVPPVGWAQSTGYTPADQPGSPRPGTPGRPQDSGYHVPPHRQNGAEPPETGGGRRRRAEGQPTWQESRQNATPENEPSGSHAAGRSVSELLASHGGGRSPSTPRRRRRKD